MLDVFELRRQGCLATGWRGIVKSGNGGSWPAVREPGKITIGETTIPIRPHVALPLEVFGCPKCGRDAYRLHYVEGEWRCRTCPPRLRYSSECRNLSIVGYARALYLRRRLHADLRLFSPLPPLPVMAHKRLALAIELRAIEAQLAAHGETIAGVLERRHARRSRRSHS